MATKKQSKFIFLLLFLLFVLVHFYQLNNQHWSSILDQDLIIIYNSLLISSGIEQDYRDHPGFTTFFLNSLIYKFFGIFSKYPVNIDTILSSGNVDKTLQIYFFLSRSINFFLNIIIIFLFSKIIKSFEINRQLRFLLCIIFIFSIGFISSFFYLRSENISLLFLCLSIYMILCGTKNSKLNFFLGGIFLCLAMLAKIQVIFLGAYIIFLITKLSIKNSDKFYQTKVINYYLIFSLILGIFIYFTSQIYLQDFARFQTNKYLDPLFFFVALVMIFTYFYLDKNFKKNILFFSSLMNGFIFLIIFLLILDQLELLPLNKMILLRLSNPIHYMTEFTGDMANGVINTNYLKQSLMKFLLNYKLNIFELLLLIFLFVLNLKNKNYLYVIFFILIFNILVMNFRYMPPYHIYYIFIFLLFFVEAIKNLKFNFAYKITNFAVAIFMINSFTFFTFKEHNYNFKNTLSRENIFLKVCKEAQQSTPSIDSNYREFIKYWSLKIDDEKIKKICDEMT